MLIGQQPTAWAIVNAIEKMCFSILLKVEQLYFAYLFVFCKNLFYLLLTQE